jgi:hypothetical protein
MYDDGQRNQSAFSILRRNLFISYKRCCNQHSYLWWNHFNYVSLQYLKFGSLQDFSVLVMIFSTNTSATAIHISICGVTIKNLFFTRFVICFYAIFAIFWEESFHQTQVLSHSIFIFVVKPLKICLFTTGCAISSVTKIWKCPKWALNIVLYQFFWFYHN